MTNNDQEIAVLVPPYSTNGDDCYTVTVSNVKFGNYINIELVQNVLYDASFGHAYVRIGDEYSMIHANVEPTDLRKLSQIFSKMADDLEEYRSRKIKLIQQ
jgi:hypothetical protein